MNLAKRGPNPFRYLSLYRSVYYSKVRKFEAAREHFDKCSDGVERHYPFVPVYEAHLWTKERRGNEAFERFSAVSASLTGTLDDNQRYLKLFCDFYVALYLRDPIALEYRALAAQIKPTGLMALALTFPQEELIQATLAERDLSARSVDS